MLINYWQLITAGFQRSGRVTNSEEMIELIGNDEIDFFVFWNILYIAYSAYFLKHKNNNYGVFS